MMSTNRNFPWALAISLSAHILILFSLSVLNILPKDKIIKGIEVNYLKIKPAVLEKAGIKSKTRDNPDKLSLSQPLSLSADNKFSPFSGAKRDDVLAMFSKPAQKPALGKIEFLRDAPIKLSEVEMESSLKLARKPAYLTYNNFLRERIRRCLYNKFSEVSDEGVVCLKFALKADGSLLEYLVIDEKSQASERLKRMAVEGLLDASPFPPLPKELDSPLATFSVIIHFIEQEGE
ncbi:MAG: energy transducer TonB [Candidatus Omnitrophota bacterium]